MAYQIRIEISLDGEDNVFLGCMHDYLSSFNDENNKDDQIAMNDTMRAISILIAAKHGIKTTILDGLHEDLWGDSLVFNSGRPV